MALVHAWPSFASIDSNYVAQPSHTLQPSALPAPAALVELARRIYGERSAPLTMAALWGRTLPSAAARRARTLVSSGAEHILFVGDESATSLLVATLGAQSTVANTDAATSSWLATHARTLGLTRVTFAELDDHPRGDAEYDAAVVELSATRRRYVGLYTALRHVRVGGAIWLVGATVDADEQAALEPLLPGLVRFPANEHALLPSGLVLEPAADLLCIRCPALAPSLQTLASRAACGSGLRWDYDVSGLRCDDRTLALLASWLQRWESHAKVTCAAPGGHQRLTMTDSDGATLIVRLEPAAGKAWVTSRQWRGWSWASIGLCVLDGLCGNEAARVQRYRIDEPHARIA